MKISIKHNNTEIVVDDSDNGTTIKYSTAELIKVIEKMSLEIQEIESNYNKIIEQEPLPIGVGGYGFINAGLEICTEFVADTINSSATKCMRCNKEKWQHPLKSIIAGM